jgi:hypothetical protein
MNFKENYSIEGLRYMDKDQKSYEVLLNPLNEEFRAFWIPTKFTGDTFSKYIRRNKDSWLWAKDFGPKQKRIVISAQGQKNMDILNASDILDFNTTLDISERINPIYSGIVSDTTSVFSSDHIAETREADLDNWVDQFEKSIDPIQAGKDVIGAKRRIRWSDMNFEDFPKYPKSALFRLSDKDMADELDRHYCDIMQEAYEGETLQQKKYEYNGKEHCMPGLSLPAEVIQNKKKSFNTQGHKLLQTLFQTAQDKNFISQKKLKNIDLNRTGLPSFKYWSDKYPTLAKVMELIGNSTTTNATRLANMKKSRDEYNLKNPTSPQKSKILTGSQECFETSICSFMNWLWIAKYACVDLPDNIYSIFSSATLMEQYIASMNNAKELNFTSCDTRRQKLTGVRQVIDYLIDYVKKSGQMGHYIQVLNQSRTVITSQYSIEDQIKKRKTKKDHQYSVWQKNGKLLTIPEIQKLLKHSISHLEMWSQYFYGHDLESDVKQKYDIGAIRVYGHNFQTALIITLALFTFVQRNEVYEQATTRMVGLYEMEDEQGIFLNTVFSFDADEKVYRGLDERTFPLGINLSLFFYIWLVYMRPIMLIDKVHDHLFLHYDGSPATQKDILEAVSTGSLHVLGKRITMQDLRFNVGANLYNEQLTASEHLRLYSAMNHLAVTHQKYYTFSRSLNPVQRYGDSIINRVLVGLNIEKEVNYEQACDLLKQKQKQEIQQMLLRHKQEKEELDNMWSNNDSI